MLCEIIERCVQYALVKIRHARGYIYFIPQFAREVFGGYVGKRKRIIYMTNIYYTPTITHSSTIYMLLWKEKNVKKAVSTIHNLHASIVV